MELETVGVFYFIFFGLVSRSLSTSWDIFCQTFKKVAVGGQQKDSTLEILLFVSLSVPEQRFQSSELELKALMGPHKKDLDNRFDHLLSKLCFLQNIGSLIPSKCQDTKTRAFEQPTIPSTLGRLLKCKEA